MMAPRDPQKLWRRVKWLQQVDVKPSDAIMGSRCLEREKVGREVELTVKSYLNEQISPP